MNASSLVLLGLLAWSGCAGVSHLPRQAASCRITRNARIELTLARNFMLVPANLDGHPAQLLLDTGAAVSTITPQAAAWLHLPRDPHGLLLEGIGGQVLSDVVRAPTLELGGMVLRDRRLSVGPIVPLPDADPPLIGVLGADVLGGHDIDLDVPNHRMDLYTVGSCPDFRPWPQSSVLAITRSSQGLLFASVAVDGHAVRALIDTGARISVVSRRLAASVGVGTAALASDPVANGRGFGAATTVLRRHRFTRLRIGGLAIEQPTIAVTDHLFAGIDMLLGADVLGQRELWLSYPAARLYVR